MKMAQACTQVWLFMRGNVNNPYRIFLKSHWQITVVPHAADKNRRCLIAKRVFHQPSGLTNLQVVRFCFKPVGVQFLIDDDELPINIVNGLASAQITDIIQQTHRVEIRWDLVSASSSRFDSPTLPEHFEAWLEISEDTATG